MSAFNPTHSYESCVYNIFNIDYISCPVGVDLRLNSSDVYLPID